MEFYNSQNNIEGKGKENETKMEELIHFNNLKTIVDKKIIVKKFK